jgi:hypothetical protein
MACNWANVPPRIHKISVYNQGRILITHATALDDNPPANHMLKLGFDLMTTPKVSSPKYDISPGDVKSYM